MPKQKSSATNNAELEGTGTEINLDVPRKKTKVQQEDKGKAAAAKPAAKEAIQPKRPVREQAPDPPPRSKMLLSGLAAPQLPGPPEIILEFSDDEDECFAERRSNGLQREFDNMRFALASMQKVNNHFTSLLDATTERLNIVVDKTNTIYHKVKQLETCVEGESCVCRLFL
jgi:hypothetical protein